ncbi:biopolymer transporter ExbD [Megasphaera sp. UPII 135-E]|uniref:ExbD/TolR family protein n=1 Tax=Megasphaera sp. UPII 135-E TaxID=1000569 RepID=UPI00021A1B65|nr:biopolymer transporter ExbD [Megasphaera sp. UPII 135-E]EGS36670.1 transport energizing protein, ExbD/TolR family [Megasphaera sp. UPII 135-E]
MRLRKKMVEKPEVMIIPMIDIMFFLVVFFMLAVVGTSALHVVPVQLPVISQGQSSKDEVYVITLRQNHQLYVADQPITLRDLSKKLSEHPKVSIVLRANKDVSYSEVMQVLDRLRQEGISRVGLGGEQRQR